LLVGGKIESADIYAARIHGSEGGKSGALTFYDTANGISFKTGYNDDDEKETFSIGLNGFKAGENQFITIGENNQVNFTGHQLEIDNKAGKGTLGLAFKESRPALYHYINDYQNCGLYFDTDALHYEITTNSGTLKKMSMSANDVCFMGTVSFCADGQNTNF
jgi:hypothetical protein